MDFTENAKICTGRVSCQGCPCRSECKRRKHFYEKDYEEILEKAEKKLIDIGALEFMAFFTGNKLMPAIVLQKTKEDLKRKREEELRLHPTYVNY